VKNCGAIFITKATLFPSLAFVHSNLQSLDLVVGHDVRSAVPNDSLPRRLQNRTLTLTIAVKRYRQTLD